MIESAYLRPFMCSLHSRSPKLSSLQCAQPACSQHRSRPHRVHHYCAARCQLDGSVPAARRIVLLAATAALLGRPRDVAAAEEPQPSSGEATNLAQHSADPQVALPPPPAAETSQTGQPDANSSPAAPAVQPEQKPSAGKVTNGQGQSIKPPNGQPASPPEAGGSPGAPASQPEQKPPAGKGSNGQPLKPSNGQAKQPSSAADDISIEEARKLLSEEEERRKQRRRRKGRLRELEEIRAELAEKELVLLEREQEVLEREQTVGTLREQLEIEKKLRALLTKEKEKAEEEAALSMGMCAGGFLLP